MSARFTSPAPEEMTDEQRALYQLFASGRRARPGAAFSLVDESGRLQGPPAAWVLVPAVGRALEQLGGAMRYELTLPARASEIAILLVGHQHRSPFELHAHTRAGAAAGLSPEDLGALAAGQPPALTTETERAVYTVTRRLLAAGTLEEDEFARAAGALGTGPLFELVTLVGYYTMVALQLNAFGLLPPSDPGGDHDLLDLGPGVRVRRPVPGEQPFRGAAQRGPPPDALLFRPGPLRAAVHPRGHRLRRRHGLPAADRQVRPHPVGAADQGAAPSRRAPR